MQTRAAILGITRRILPGRTRNGERIRRRQASHLRESSSIIEPCRPSPRVRRRRPFNPALLDSEQYHRRAHPPHAAGAQAGRPGGRRHHAGRRAAGVSARRGADRPLGRPRRPGPRRPHDAVRRAARSASPGTRGGSSCRCCDRSTRSTRPTRSRRRRRRSRTACSTCCCSAPIGSRCRPRCTTRSSSRRRSGCRRRPPTRAIDPRGAAAAGLRAAGDHRGVRALRRAVAEEPRHVGRAACWRRWADIAAPSRVQILDVEPGDASVARGERVAISRRDPRRPPTTSRCGCATRPSTSSSSTKSIVMTQAAAARRAVRRRAAAGQRRAAGAAGVQQDLEYWIEAGDARSRRFKLTRVRPADDRRAAGALRVPRLHGRAVARRSTTSATSAASKGRRVTIEALANQPIKSAYVDFDADGTSDLRMTRRRRPRRRRRSSSSCGPIAARRWHSDYVLRFTTTEGRTNERPGAVSHRGDARLRARGAHHAARGAGAGGARRRDGADRRRGPRSRLRGRSACGWWAAWASATCELGELLSRDHAGRFSGMKPFMPGDAQLKPATCWSTGPRRATTAGPRPTWR